MKKWVLLVLLICSAITCSLFEKKKPILDPLLKFPLTKEMDVVFKGKINEELIKDEKKIYFSTNKGCLYSMDDPEDGLKLLYQSEVDFVSPPYIHEKYIFIYDSKNYIHCLDKKGAFVWKSHVDEKITSGIQAKAGKIFFGTQEGHFLSYRVDSGEQVWKRETKAPIRSLPMVVRETIIFGCDDHHIYFLNMDGSLKYRYETEGKIRGSLIYKNKLLYFGSNDEHFYCFNLDKNKIQWKVKVGGKVDTHPLIQQKYVLFTAWNNVVFCLNNKNGTVLWWNQIPARCQYRMELVGNRLLVPSLSSKLECFDIDSGKILGNYETGHEIKSNPLWFNSYVILSVYVKESDSSQMLFLSQNKEE